MQYYYFNPIYLNNKNMLLFLINGDSFGIRLIMICTGIWNGNLDSSRSRY